MSPLVQKVVFGRSCEHLLDFHLADVVVVEVRKVRLRINVIPNLH